MSSDDLVIYKIEQLEKALTARATTVELALQIQAQKVEMALTKQTEKTETFQREMYQALLGTAERPGIVGRLQDVEQTTGTIKRIFWIVVTPILAGLGAFTIWK